MKFFIGLLLLLSSLSLLFAQKGSSSQQQRGPSAIIGGGSDSDKPIEVHGQTRNLNMLLKLQSEREEIDFIKLRKDYEEEIEELNY